jgi:broad specificity phosphatase PhoE
LEEIYLCRHGETEWTLSGRHTSHTDLSLTENGKSQAQALGKHLHGIHFDAVYSSPRKRCLETCKQIGLHPQIDPDLSEWDYGDYEGKMRKELPQGWNLFLEGAPNGESPEEVALRADRFLKKLPQGKIAIISHGHFARVLAARWLKLPVESARYFFLSVASLSILGHEREQPVIRLWNASGLLNLV